MKPLRKLYKRLIKEMRIVDIMDESDEFQSLIEELKKVKTVGEFLEKSKI